MKTAEVTNKCQVCGCTDQRPCFEGCWIVAPHLCSRCAAKLEAQTKDNALGPAEVAPAAAPAAAEQADALMLAQQAQDIIVKRLEDATMPNPIRDAIVSIMRQELSRELHSHVKLAMADALTEAAQVVYPEAAGPSGKRKAKRPGKAKPSKPAKDALCKKRPDLPPHPRHWGDCPEKAAPAAE